MYLKSLQWTEGKDADRAYTELACSLDIEETDLRDTFTVKSTEAELHLYGGAQLIRFDVTSSFSEQDFDSVFALRVQRVAHAPASGSGGEAAAMDGADAVPEKETRLFKLDGTSEPIHGANEWCGVPLTHETVMDYVRFFGFAVYGDEGAFNIVEEKPDAAADLSPGTLFNLRPVVLDAALDSTGRFRVRAPVVYGNALFNADFAVSPDGSIEMVDDSPVSGEVTADQLDTPRLDGWGALESEIVGRTRWATQKGGDVKGHAKVGMGEFRRWLEKWVSLGVLGDEDHDLRTPDEQIELLSLSTLSQSFLPTMEILRVRYRARGREHASVFLAQKLDRSLPEFLPVNMRPVNFASVVQTLGTHLALDVSEANGARFALFAAAEVLDLPTLAARGDGGADRDAVTRARAFSTREAFPIRLAEEAGAAAATWSSRQAAVTTLVLAAEQMLAREKASPTTAADKLKFHIETIAEIRRLIPIDDGPPPVFGIRVKDGTGVLFVERPLADSREGSVEWLSSFKDPMEATEFAKLPDKVAEIFTREIGDELYRRLNDLRFGVAAIRHLQGKAASEPPSAFSKDRFGVPRVNEIDETVSVAIFVEQVIGGATPRSRLLALDVLLNKPTASITCTHVVEIGVWSSVGPHWGTSRTIALDKVFQMDLDRARVARRLYTDLLREQRPPSVMREMTAEDARGHLIERGELSDAIITGNLKLGAGPGGPARVLSVRLRNCTIEGSLDLDGAVIHDDVLLEDVHLVNGSISAKRATIGGDVTFQRVSVVTGGRDTTASVSCLNLERAIVEGRINFEKSCFDGVVNLEFAEVGLYLQIWSTRVAHLAANRFRVGRGSFYVSSQGFDGDQDERFAFGLLSDGDVDLTHVRVRGNLILSHALVAGTLNVSRADLQDNLSIGWVESSAPSCLGRIDLDDSKIGGALVIEQCIVKSSITLSKLTVPSATIGARWVRFAPSAGQDVTVGRNIELIHSKISGTLLCQGIAVRGSLRVEHSAIGNVQIDGAARAPANGYGRGLILPTLIESGIHVRGGKIGDTFQITASIVREPTTVQPAIEISGASIGGDVDFWNADYCEAGAATHVFEEPDAVVLLEEYSPLLPGWPALWLAKNDQSWDAKVASWRRAVDAVREAAPVASSHQDTTAGSVGEAVAGAAGAGPTLVNRAVVDRHVQESRRTANSVVTFVQGNVRLSQCHVAGDVRLRNLHAPGRTLLLVELQVTGNVLADCVASHVRDDVMTGPAEAGDHETICGSLAIDQCKIGGDIELSGLRARPAILSDVPAVSVTDTVVKQSVRLVDLAVRDRQSTPTYWAQLSGALDVSGSDLGAVWLSGQSFSKWMSSPQVPGAGDGGNTMRWADKARCVRAAGARIRKLELVHSLPDPERASQVPVVDLTDVRVSTWSVHGWEDPGSRSGTRVGRRSQADLGAILMQLLERSRHRPKTYQDVESYLYNAGHEPESKAVRRDFVWRHRLEELCASLNSGVLHRLGRINGSDRRTVRLLRILAVCLVGLLAVGSARLAGLVRLLSRKPWAGVAVAAATLAFSLLWHFSASWRALGADLWHVTEMHVYAAFAGSAVLLLLPLVLFADVRAYAHLLVSALNRLVSGNFTSWGRVLFWWVLLLGFSTMFFWDPHHLDIASSYKQSFFESRTADSSSAGSPGKIAPPEPNQVTVDVCTMLGAWDVRHAALWSTRLTVPVAPSVYDQIDIENCFEPLGAQAGNPKLVCPSNGQADPFSARCGQIQPGWTVKGREWGFMHGWNAAFVALVIKVLANLLLTLLGATIASLVSRKPG